MWNSFQGALEKRVRENGQKKPRADKYIILKAAKKVLADLFGSAGNGNMEIILETEHKIKLKSQKSIWRSELTLKKKPHPQADKPRDRSGDGKRGCNFRLKNLNIVIR